MILRYTTKKEILEGIADLAEKYKAPVYTHNSESESNAILILSQSFLSIFPVFSFWLIISTIWLTM